MNIIENNPPKNPDVTIVSPVCNTSQFLPQCLDSLLAQSHENIEIICLNDGSSDNSLEILLDYQSRDGRIRVVDKPNSGYGSTMNLGFSLAKGKYTGIVESDDFADPDMFARLFSFAEWHECDLVKCSYYEYSNRGDFPQQPFFGYDYNTVFDPRENLGVLNVLPIIWAALYRTAMIPENGIRFNETPGASFQDTSFVFQCWASARRVALLPECLIHYRVDNSGSSVKSSKKVFSVCDEYALSKSFLDNDPDKKAVFAPVLNLMKIGTYNWNYDRIDDESKGEFLVRVAEEYKEAAAEGSLQRPYFNDVDWTIIQEIMRDPKEFRLMHPVDFYH